MSRVSRFSSRIARSRYFSRISSSVAGIGRFNFPGAGGLSLGVHQDLRIARRTRRARRARRARRRRRLRFEELERLDVEQAASAWCGSRRRAATRGTPRGRRSRASARAPIRGPAATCESDPAPAIRRYLAAKRAASSLKEPIATRGLKTSIASISSRIAEQVLVAGHRVHAVERMGHVDQAALAADLGDGLLEAQPARDLLAQEEADDLALASRS